MRRLLIATLPVLLAPLAGCFDTGAENPVLSPPAAPAAGPTLFAPDSSARPGDGGMLGQDAIRVPEIVAEGSFSTSGSTAITYDSGLVPVSATAKLALGRIPDGITVRLGVTGMLPRRTYGAHLHTKPCTATPAQAGPHYQHEPDPRASASPDPSYANPANEVWLDFTTDRLGAATTTAVQKWAFDELAPPRSMVVHTWRTRTGQGVAGTAGDRVACLTLPG